MTRVGVRSARCELVCLSDGVRIDGRCNNYRGCYGRAWEKGVDYI